MFSNLEKEQKRKITAQLKSPNVDSPRMNQSLATKLVAWNKDTYFAQLVAALFPFHVCFDSQTFNVVKKN